MEIIVNENFKKNKRTSMLIITFSALMGVSIFIFSFFNNFYDIFISMIILIIIISTILPFIIIHMTLPYMIIIKKDSLELKLILYKKIFLRSSFIGYDVDFNNDKRLIYRKNERSKIFHLGSLCKEYQTQIINFYKLKRYKFSISPPWGNILENEPEKIVRFKSIRTVRGFAISISICFVIIIGLTTYCFIFLNFNIVLITIILPIILIGGGLLMVVGMKIGWIVRDDGTKI